MLPCGLRTGSMGLICMAWLASTLCMCPPHTCLLSPWSCTAIIHLVAPRPRQAHARLRAAENRRLHPAARGTRFRGCVRAATHARKEDHHHWLETQAGKYNLKFGDKGKTYDLKVLSKDDPKDEGWLNVTKGSLAEVRCLL